MVDLPFKSKFDALPEINPEEFVQYFNLEFGISTDSPDGNPFTVADFSYIGLYVIDGIETMCWSVKGQDVCATVQPYENSYLMGMGSLPTEDCDS